MSEERKEQRPLDDRLSGEEDLSVLYQQTEKELPPPNLDVTVLDAARQAVRFRPRRVYFFPSRTWVVPLSLAAALVVSLGVTQLLRREIAALPVSSLLLSAPASSPAPVVSEKDQVEEPALKSSQPLTDRQQGTLKFRANVPKEMESLKKEDTRGTSSSDLMSALEQRAETRELEGQEEKRPRSRRLSLTPSPESAARQEELLSPEQWLTKIKTLRRAGKHAEAEASLAAFKKKYPHYPLDQLLSREK